MKTCAESEWCIEYFNKLVVQNFSYCSNNLDAFDVFRMTVNNYLLLFEIEDFMNLLQTINTNSQVYELSDMKQIIQATAKEKFDEELDILFFANLMKFLIIAQ